MGTAPSLTAAIGAVCLVLSGAATAAGSLPPIVESQPEAATSSSGSEAAAAPDQPPRPRQARPKTLEERVTRLERVMDNEALVNMLMRLQNLQQEVQELRGQIEVQTHAIDGIKQRQRELYLDIDRRMRQLETAAANAPQSPASGSGAGAAPGAPGAPVPPVSGTGPSADGASGAAGAGTDQPAVDPLAEQKAYQKAFDVLKAGRYEESIEAFRAFLSRYPDGEYSANAQYWLGEANYVMNRIPAAIDEFRKVVELYPDSSKTADAMLKLGYSNYELERYDQARETLSKLVERFPDSTAAQLAQNRLHRMRLEGRQ